MSDGREEREEQEQRRKWEKEKKDREDDLERDWERDGDRERRDSRAAEVAALDAAVRSESGVRTRRSFLIAAAAAASGYGFYRWLDNSPMNMRLQEPLRHMLRLNAKVSRAIFDERGLAPTYPVAKSMELRTNGNYGLKMDLVPESYRLQMVGVQGAKEHPQYVDDVTAWEYQYETKKDAGPVEHDTKVRPKSEPAGAGDATADGSNSDAGAGNGPMMNGGPASTMVGSGKGSLQKVSPELEAAMKRMKRRPRGQEEAGMSRSTLMPGTPGLLLTMDAVTSLPHRELVTQFKCIEGWSQIVHWGGYRLADLLAKYPPAKKADGSLPKYVYMETPDGDYYCGFNLQACLHPQSLLVTEMAGRPVPQWHGAPMRLHMPIKYGYKQIKRIGLIAYTDMRPDDYWTKLGYDWYAGL
ncbi:molybdopterin-dependent oxidoreductase [Granulicella sp. S190]|uniref:molybdopterin-dependent oxidoreductase n=1 Tax=Granulicella sp. S190 TaxID=1747226 RepID=UPI00131DE9A3|nr:molybdopterin-dependent oxidoreductase [Granulicella sp. S190]